MRGFYTAASGMIAQQRRQETLSNNIANANTPGYKADDGSMRAFPELLIQRMESNDIPTSRGLNLPVNQEVGSLNTGVYMQEAIPSFEQGDVRETGNETDMALVQGNLPDEEGSLFFTVQTEDGERYTRNGNFTVDGEGFLTTNQGHYVLNQAGDPIQTGGMDFNVTNDGILQVDDQEIPLGLSYSSNANDLVKEGSGLFQLSEDGAPLLNARTEAGVTFNVRQSFLERSNVDAARTMADMNRTYRSFEMNQRVLKMYDQNMQQAVSQIGRLR
nr:flagellar hook-basal body protein [Thalassobacillus sp. CUG 92003]